MRERQNEKEKGNAMERVSDQICTQSVPPSLIEFLLGDGIRRGWLEEHRIAMYSAPADYSRSTPEWTYS
jgi:hypothetical protein